ncbi:hypothetical protein PYW07_002136 [Mythimna separata]|uniref:Uncharacterized protein n=1 Tax=Mythimna separata TaxID=271217 RepID=A0AAD8DTW1_MYTSE|nr:hypothetical protein PYW07_002136 [Mythimna separata]
MASRSQEPPAEEPAPTKYLAPTLASLTESLSLLGVSPETLAMSLGESLAERYLASLRSKPVERVERPMERIIERPLAPLGGGCGIPRHTPLAEPSLQLFSNDFIDYLNQIA